MNAPLRIQIIGGLGNQIHGLVAGFVLRSKLDRDIILDGRWLSWTGSNGSRRMQLNEIQISKNFHPIIYRSIPSIRRGPLRRRIQTVVSRVDGLVYRNAPCSDDYISARNLIEFLCDNPEINAITGYFSTWDWAQLAAVDPKLMLSLSRPSSKKFEQLMGQVELVIGVHIRLGDYLDHPDVYLRLAEEYYFEGIKTLSSDRDVRFWIFTDDEANLSIFYPNLVAKAEKVIGEATLSNLESFALLSNLKKLVIANSTFSSWAAFFAETIKGSQIICPKNYLVGGDKDTRPSSWKRL
jgi:hypothetical protein